MTRLNLNIKLVDEYLGGPRYRTAVWLSDSAWSAVRDFERADQLGARFVAKLKHCAIAGFRNHYGGFVRKEPAGAFALGDESSLFRLYGFYFGANEFIGIDAFTKRTTRLSGAERSRIVTVAYIRDNELWKKR